MLCTPRDWQQMKQNEALRLAGTPEGDAKLAEAKRYRACADEIEQCHATMVRASQVILIAEKIAQQTNAERAYALHDGLIDALNAMTPNGGVKAADRSEA